MKCDNKFIDLIHEYLDGDISKEDEKYLSSHLEKCEACQIHFRELKQTVALITTNVDMKPSENFTLNVMDNLPMERKGKKITRWMKVHPIFTAAAIFFILMLGGMISDWNQSEKLTYPKGMNLVVENDTVIVPEGVIIDEDITVKNGDLQIEGEVKGNVVVVNGNHLTASTGNVVGEIQEIDRMFSWMWYRLKQLFENIFSL
ncbi:anti-sigma factor RsiW [Gracilibacillus halotolerans]|uniref:Anti-sigma-W factor RsiW n=1 Tax=Gracilibacillus halotolerans TaxID=74386 RepID=A0A841RT64_9BACI|nr:zf-HC2 domain-containing protein [Gracilibacillus halotolerans]MBB6514405.1 anti-sigma factor RsiW [Gracilibacillus halotolerans]